MSIIESPIWLNRAFLETCLRSESEKDTLKIVKFDIRKATGKGDNYTSNMYRVFVETAENKTFSVIIKHLLESGKAGDLVRESTSHLRETTMLKVILPQLTALLNAALPEKCEPFAAQFIFSNDGVLVVEDLSQEGFTMAERRKGLDLANCLIVMRTIARFHAASVILHQRDPHCMTPFKESVFSEPVNQERLKIILTGQLNMLANEIETWSEFGGKFEEKIRAFSKDVLGHVNRTSKRDDSAFNVLNHGDLWVNNILFRNSESGDPEALKFVDYQLTHYTSPAIDLLYFMNSSPRDEVRVHHNATLLQEYHDTLCDTLRYLGYSKKLITLEELKKEYDSKAVYGMFVACVLSPIVLSDPNSGFDLDASLESGGAGSSMFSGETFKNNIKRMLPIFEQQGVFSNL